MARQASKFIIKEQDLAKALEIPINRLDEIIDIFDADPYDEWELKENDHFVFSNRSLKERVFSAHGAFAIAKYLDTHEKKSLWDKIREFVTRHKEKIRNAFIHRTVHENSSSLTYRNNRHFLSKKDVVAILATSYSRLNKAFDEIKRSERPLERYVDFDDIEGVRYYSLSGFYQLSQNLSKTLTSKDRREWCRAVDIAGKAALKAIIDAQAQRQKRIEKAMRAAKSRDGSTCQITHRKRDKLDRMNADAHHIFSSKHYPHLAAVEDNIITLADDVHKEFHIWNGGSSTPCTIDDLIQFVCERYPENIEVMPRLQEIKLIFSNESSKANPRKPSNPPSLPGSQAA